MRRFIRDDNKPFVGSVSAISKYNTCQRSFWHQYIAKTSPDSDYKSPTYFSFGSAFHACLEWAKHDSSNSSTEDIRKACAIYNLSFDNDGAKLAACLRSYFANANPKLNLIACEQEVITDDWVMYIDAIFEDENWWYISDIKTVGMKLDPTIRTRLTVDPQMVNYAKYANVIAEKLNLKIDKFFGINYREVEKPRQRWKVGESWESFTQRCGMPDFREVDLSKHQLKIKEVEQNLDNTLYAIRQIKEINDTSQNMRACRDKGQVCAFYSQCFGCLFSEAKDDCMDDADKF